MSKLLWFVLGSVATLVAGAVVTHITEDDVVGAGEGTLSAPENTTDIGEENPAEAG